MKILDVTKFYSESGGGVKTYLAAKSRWAARHDDIGHVVVIPGPRDSVDEHDGSRVYRIRGPRIPVSPAYRFLLSTRKLRAILERERPDIVEIGSPFFVPWITRRAARGGTATLVGFYHCEIVSAYAGRLTPARPRIVRRLAVELMRRYVRAVHSRLALTIAASESTVRLLRETGVTSVARVPLGVDTELFHPRRRDPSWRESLGTPTDAPLLLYAGRLCREKEVDVIMRAVPELCDRLGAAVVFVGAGHLTSDLDRLSRAYRGRVKLIPYQTDRRALARIYASADLLLAPFSSETFGLAVLEGMASGLPVAGADAMAAGDLLHGRAWARAFEPGDPTDLTRAVGSLLDQDLRALGRQARSDAESFTWDRTFDRLADVYRAHLGGRPGARTMDRGVAVAGPTLRGPA